LLGLLTLRLRLKVLSHPKGKSLSHPKVRSLNFGQVITKVFGLVEEGGAWERDDRGNGMGE
jgi:hypothetical protein